MESEILVSISFRVPQVDRHDLVPRLAPLFNEAIIAGGDTLHISLTPYNPDEDADSG